MKNWLRTASSRLLLGAGLFSVYGILSAVIGRQTSGRGQYIDASLLEAAMGLSIWETTEYWGTGRAPASKLKPR